MSAAPVFVFGIDGADYDLVRELLDAGRLPTLARLREQGAFGPLESTEPPITPVAWSTFLTGLQPGRHGIFNFSTNPWRGGYRVQSAADRAGTPIWRFLQAAGKRSALVLIPFTYPIEPVGGVVISGYGGPERPAIDPPEMARAVNERFPGLVTAHHPMRQRYWEDYDRFRRMLVQNVDEVEELCRFVIEREKPDFFCVDFMPSDTIGHLAYHLRDAESPAHEPARAADHIGEVYDRVDAAVGRLIADAERAHGGAVNAVVLSDHGMKPIHHVFHVNQWLADRGHLRYRRRSAQRIRGLARIDSKLAMRHRWYPALYDRVVPFGAPAAYVNRTMRDIDRWRTDAYAYGTGGPVYFNERAGRHRDRAYQERLMEELQAEPSPIDGSPAFTVRRGSEVHRGPHTDRAPDLVVIPNDPRLLADASRRTWPSAWVRHEHLDPSHNYGFSGHHGPTGILAAAGPAVDRGVITQASIADLTPTVLTMLGVEAQTQFDGSPLALFRPAPEQVASGAAETSGDGGAVYSQDEEQAIHERLQALGYE